MTSLSDLRIKLRAEYIKIDPNGKIWGNTTIDSLLNRAYFQVQKDGGHRRPAQYDSYAINATAGVGEYALPIDFIKMEVPLCDSRALSKTTKSALMRSVNGAFTQGTPQFYYIQNTSIGLYPLPQTSSAVNIEYYKRLANLTDSQDSELPEDFDDAICTYAAYLAFNSVSKIDKASVMRADYSEILSTLLSSYIYDDMNISYSYQNGNYNPSDTSTLHL